MAEADVHLNIVYAKLSLQGKSEKDKYSAIDAIVAELNTINKAKKINPKTTGTITERLCKLGIDSVGLNSRPFGESWRWVGDFLLPGHPYDLAISNKSFTVRERLLASGTGSLLAPIVGWGLFNDPSEWKEDRVRSYLFRGFIAIYMPENTYLKITKSALSIQNINGKPVLRKLKDFPANLQSTIIKVNNENRIDVRKF